MGVTITGYSNIKITKNIIGDEKVHIESGGFEQSNMPHIEECDYFDYEEGSNPYQSSYTYYGIFRDSLCKLSNNISQEKLWEMKDKSLKFYYLINFSDCEGYIGTSYCKIIYDEFTKYEDEIISKLDAINPLYYKNTYLELKEIFRLGSNDGIVVFS